MFNTDFKSENSYCLPQASNSSVHIYQQIDPQKILDDILELEKLERSLDIEWLPEITSDAFYFTPLGIDPTAYSSKFPDIANEFPNIRQEEDSSESENSVAGDHSSDDKSIEYQKVLSDRLRVLTGRLDSHLIPKDASEALRENLNTARKIISLIDRLIPFSENYLQRSRIFKESFSDPDFLSVSKCVINNSFNFVRKKYSTKNSLEYNINEILKYKTGNCGMLCLAGYYLAKQGCPEVGLKRDSPVQMVEFDRDLGGDHTFLIIGGEEENAAICCPLTRSYFPLSTKENHLIDFLGTREFDSVQFTFVRKFDPSIHRIVSALPNFCFTAEPISDNATHSSITSLEEHH